MGKATRYDLSLPEEELGFDPAAFDTQIRGNGVLMEHYRAIRCPIGITNISDPRTHTNHSECSNGFIYKHAGDVTVSFAGNSTSTRLQAMGIMDGSTVQVTVPRTYDNSEKEFAVQIYDRLFLKEIATTSVNTQLIESNITGTDRLQYKASEVEHLIDSHGTEYSVGDFEVKDGNIVWSAKRPPFDPKTGRGTTYSIRYRYTPFWYVDRLMHEVRIARVMKMPEQEVRLERMPHGLLLKREYLFENEERVRNTMSDERDQPSQRSGSFGSR
jgi:hypothetical protein